ncbi:MAG TPA: hypothetical protein VEQ40_00845, partial [Pyrinomonadaceae bacterium]|nr:hypothetical protein [Pyrinomonadaceae bacterium]
FMVERTVKPLFDERLERLRVSVERGSAAEARSAFEAVMGFTVCDPTMGSAPFLRSAFDYLVESTQYFQLHRHVAALKARHPALYEEIVGEYEFLGAKGGRLDANGIGGWEWHVLRCVLYGVDIDLKAVCIACQTFALSSMRHLKQGERFPSYFNINLKLGNALISPTHPADRARLAAEHGAEIAELIGLRRRARSLSNTEEAYGELVELFREADRVRLPIVKKMVEERVYDVLGDFTDELRPFSWELEFPEIFFNADGTLKEAAGFDVVIGNPPWEAIKFNDNEFLRSIGASEGTNVEELCEENEAVASAYEHYREVLERWKSWVNTGGQYEYQQGGRYRNKWRLATEVSWKLTQPQGAMSLVVPGGIIADDGGFALKQWIFPEGKAESFISFEKENDVFTGSQDFTVMSFRKGHSTREVKHIEGLTQAEQLYELPYMPITLPLETVQAMSPSALAIPSIRDEIEASLLSKLYQHPLIINTTAVWYAITVSYDYNMGHGRPFFRRDGKGIPLLEGKSIKQYEVFPVEQIRIRVTERRQEEPNGQYRVACADVTGTLDARRMICTVVPHGYATGDKLNCFLVEGEDAERLYLVGLLNSFVIEWRVRQLARSNNVKRFMLVQLPVPRPPKADVERIAAHVSALVTSDARFKDLQPLLNGAQPATAEAERHDLKCRIDAEVAHLFGLTEEELDRVLAAFDKVPISTKELVRSHFKTLGTGRV